jgi:GNAT superfamily N-acetyltransferase
MCSRFIETKCHNRQPMLSILSSTSAPHYLKQLRDWFESEWGQVDAFDENHDGLEVPPPLIVIDDKDLLAGGLAFSSFSKPKCHEFSVWINALLVAPEHRGKGIASQLIHAAEDEARRIAISELFVHTGVPVLYQKLGWKIIERNGANCVLTKVTSLDR